MQEKITFPGPKQKIIDGLLEQHKFHTEEKKRLEAELIIAITDKSDSENRNEQIHVQNIVHESVDNPIVKKIQKEEKEIAEIESQIAKQANQ